MLTLKNGFWSSPLDMFYFKHYTFDFFSRKKNQIFFRPKISFFFVEKKSSAKKNLKNFRRKKRAKIFFRPKIKSIYFGVKHIQRRAPNSVWARRTISLKLLIILMDIDRRYPFKVRARPKSLGDLFFAKSGNPKTVSGTYFLLKFFPRFARGFIFMFFLINFVPKIPNKLKIPQNFLRASRGDLFFSFFSFLIFCSGTYFFLISIRF